MADFKISYFSSRLDEFMLAAMIRQFSVELCPMLRPLSVNRVVSLLNPLSTVLLDASVTGHISARAVYSSLRYDRILCQNTIGDFIFE